MLWAIDVGNTHTVVGLHDGNWRAVWRLATDPGDTEDHFAAVLGQLCDMANIPMNAIGVVVGSVVPSVNAAWASFSQEWLGCKAHFVETGAQVGLEVSYDPPHAVGADRIANALAAIKKYGAPVIVVDFGTATTFDTIDSEGRYVGGAILPGVLVSLNALSHRAAKLPSVSLQAPEKAIGRNTVDALQSGVMFGYAGSVDSLCKKISAELGGHVNVVATGGLAGAFLDLCQSFDTADPTLTLDGLAIAFSQMASLT